LATLSAQQIGIGSTAAVMSPATAGGDKCSAGGRTFLVVNNASGAPITVTLTAYGTGPGGNPVSNRVVSVAAGTTDYIGPLDPAGFTNPADGLVQIAYSAVTSVTVGCFTI
jgi:hypothetical protein